MPSKIKTVNKNNSITIIDYNEKKLIDKKIKRIEDCLPYKDTDTVTWINIDNVPPLNFLQQLRLGFDLHPVIIEDIMNVKQRPKIELMDNYIYLVFKMLTLEEKTNQTVSEQISLIISHKFIITFQQGLEGDTFAPVRKLIHNDDEIIRNKGTDYLAAKLIDSVVFNYFNVIEKVNEKIDLVEHEVINHNSPKAVKNIHQAKREIMTLRKLIWPLREIINILEKYESLIIKKPTKIYFRDIYERLTQIIDNLETSRDTLSGILDIHLSSVSNRTNEVMKILTIITTIFMPLSFIAGFYGMNFRYLPGIENPLGPIFISVLIISIGTIMVLFFRGKKWL